jgi:hypothetical protein
MDMTTSTTTEKRSPFFCDMNAIEPTQRKQHVATAIEVFGAVQEIHELPTGYAFRLPNEATILLKTAEFIRREKLCCPFFGFRVEVEPEGGPLWLRLTGGDGIKPFIRAEIGEALPETVARTVQFR